MVASASFDFLRWVRESWAAFRESGWNIFSLFDLGLEGPAMVMLRRVRDVISMSLFCSPPGTGVVALDASPVTSRPHSAFATPLVGHRDG